MTDVKIVGTGRVGDFVLKNQSVGTQNGFKNVSLSWLDKCRTYEQGMDELLKGRAKTEDFSASILRFRPEVVDGKMQFVDQESGRNYLPSFNCLNNLSRWAGTGLFLPTKLMSSRDPQDHDTLVRVISNGLRRVDKEKILLWRTRQDGTLRAVLSDRYMTVNNEWVLDTLKKILPGGRLSHWRGDEDTIYGNVLIPDQIRQEVDSDYGGMISVGNSEIGTRHLSSLPSVFRAICMNGCIWDQTHGVALRLRHNGEVDYDALFSYMRDHINSQIPLLNIGVDRLLGTRSMRWRGDSMNPLFAQVAIDFKVARQPMAEVLEAYAEEESVSMDSRKTLFGIINAFTRAGQGLSNETWYAFDTIGGSLSGYSQQDWDSLTGRAWSIRAATVENVLGLSL